jgi:hypothetical protein
MKIFVILLLLGIVLLITDVWYSSQMTTSAVVVERGHVDAAFSVNPGVDSNGGMIVTTQSTPEKYLIIVDSGGYAESFDVGPVNYLRMPAGTTVSIVRHNGRWTGINWWNEVGLP